MATVVMLVLLRLNIGWHFFSEGVKHYSDPRWTSEPVLRDAKGPLAPWFHAYLPDFHGFEQWLHQERAQNESHAIESWVDEIVTEWDGYRQKFDEYYALNEAQRKQARNVLAQYQERLRDWAAGAKDALVTHVHEWRRKETARETPAADLPFQKKRILEKQNTLAGEAGGWLAELRALEADYHQALRGVLQGDQTSRTPLAGPVTSIDLVDDTMTYVILGVGLLLILGLFTRLACVVGALFLFSVVMMQPFWIDDTHPTFNQYVEMFALLALATTTVGRWAGLDLFVHYLISGSRSATKGKTDVSAS